MKWTTRPLAEVADFCLGKMLDEKKNKGETLPYLANINVRWGEFDLEDLREMRFEHDELERYGLRYGDIVMCEGGEPGRCAIWKEPVPGIMIQKALHRIRPADCLDHRFLFYTFLNKGKIGAFDALFTGTTIKHLPRQQLAKIEIAFPDLDVQRRIADVLSAYDDLIENNRRRIKLLETAVRLLYQEWFVLFRFPGHEHVRMIDGAPDGWERRALVAVIEVNPTTPVNKNKSVIYVPMAALSTVGMSVSSGLLEERSAATAVHFRNGDTLLARITPCLENGKTAYVNFLSEGETACGSTEFIVLRGKQVSSYFVYCLARTERLRGIAIKSMIGSSGRQRVQESCFDEFMVPMPPKELLQSFDEFAAPAFREIRQLSAANDRLRKARDLLLPRLMSGEVEV